MKRVGFDERTNSSHQSSRKRGDAQLMTCFAPNQMTAPLSPFHDFFPNKTTRRCQEKREPQLLCCPFYRRLFIFRGHFRRSNADLISHVWRAPAKSWKPHRPLPKGYSIFYIVPWMLILFDWHQRTFKQHKWLYTPVSNSKTQNNKNRRILNLNFLFFVLFFSLTKEIPNDGAV